MANNNTPFGLRAKNSANSGDYSAKLQPYYLSSSYATATFTGDPVVKTGTSNAAEFDGSEPGSLSEINKSTAGTGNASTGVIVGFSPQRDNLTLQYNPASTERIALVLDDPYATFEIQDDGVVALDETAVGLNANFIFTDPGETAYGTSGVELNSSTVAVGATLQMKILRLISRVDNELGANAKWLVRLNNHTEAPNSAGV